MQTMEYIRLNRHLSGAVFCLILTISAAFAPTMALCQSSSSAVNGVVTDPENAVVPGAHVTLRNVATNVERVTLSNGAGDYFFSNVPPARYTLTFATPNFQTENDLGL